MNYKRGMRLVARPAWARSALNTCVGSVCLANTCYFSDTDASSSDSQGQMCRVQGWVMYHAGIDLQSIKDPEGDWSFQRTTGLLPWCLDPASSEHLELDLNLLCFGYFFYYSLLSFTSLLFLVYYRAVLVLLYLSDNDKEKMKLWRKGKAKHEAEEEVDT